MPKGSTVQVFPSQNITNKLIVSSLKYHFKIDTKKILGQIQYIHNSSSTDNNLT